MAPRTRSKTKQEQALLPKPIIEDDKQDMQNIVLLVILYLLQGIPLGLILQSIPFLMKAKLNYSDMAIFSLSSYPYSLKLFWSPIVDTLFSKKIGRRKSWILPIQFILGFLFLFIGSRIDAILEEKEIPVKLLAFSFAFMVFLCATQDIAVDGWALELLTDGNKTYASTAQTIGLQTGFFISFTVFLSLNSAEVCDKYFRFVPTGKGLISLGQFLQFWGLMFLICNVWLFFFTKEKPANVHSDEITEVYSTIFGIMKMPHMRTFIVVLLICKIGFITNEAVTGLKLLDMGLPKEYLAASAMLEFPLQVFSGYFAAKWSNGRKPLRPWIIAFWGRLICAALGMLVLSVYPKDGITTWYMGIIMISLVFTSFTSTVQFVSIGSFFSKISDPTIGGTYMTLLNTLSNLGGTWPRYFILLLVEYLTVAPCSVMGKDGALKCTDEKSKTMCASLGGTCSYIADGYYMVNTLSIILGIISLGYIIPKVKQLEQLSENAWRLAKNKDV